MSRLLCLGALLAAAALPSRAAAQAPPGTNFNIAAGMSLASSGFGQRNDAGYNIIAGVGMKPATSALGFRLEGIYNEFSQKVGSDKSRAAGVTANLLYDLISPTMSRSNTVYLVGGLGYYSTREPGRFFNDASQSNTGWNVGGGFKFPLSGFSAYIEARYHAVSNVDVKFVPITFGLVF